MQLTTISSLQRGRMSLAVEGFKYHINNRPDCATAPGSHVVDHRFAGGRELAVDGCQHPEGVDNKTLVVMSLTVGFRIKTRTKEIRMHFVRVVTWVRVTWQEPIT
jgi:hypothetical protein